jgi:hypothetical protein
LCVKQSNDSNFFFGRDQKSTASAAVMHLFDDSLTFASCPSSFSSSAETQIGLSLSQRPGLIAKMKLSQRTFEHGFDST